MVILWFSTLKYLLISPLALLPLWTFYMSNQMIAISDLGNTLIIQSFEVIAMLLKIWLFLIIVSTTSNEIEVLVFSKK